MNVMSSEKVVSSDVPRQTVAAVRRRPEKYDPGFKDALDRARSGKRLEREDALQLIQAEGERLLELFEAASQVRDRAKGRTITFSKKVFLPLTNLCRNHCGYCTFRKNPGNPGAKTMLPDEVLHVVHAGEKLACKEALFSLGDKPELIFPEMRETLKRLGLRTTIAYLRQMCERVLKESNLLPHVNPGVMTERDLRELKEVSVSMGIMLENVSMRLMERGGPHFSSPDKHPMLRLRTIEDAGRLRIPFTTGILIGIGETLEERVDSLLAIRERHDRYGHIQEVIIQNFRAKPDIPMRDHPEPTLEDLARTIAVARLIFGGEMNIQAPPNLVPDEMQDAGCRMQRIRSSRITHHVSRITLLASNQLDPLHVLLQAGINDWGGISPLTIDHINPERPWPHIEKLREQVQGTGFELKERLAIYPEFIHKPDFLTPSLAARVRGRVNTDQLMKTVKSIS